MSFASASAILRTSNLLLKVCWAVMVAVSSEKLPPNYKISKKAESEPSVIPSSARKWKRGIFRLLVLVTVAVGTAWYFSIFGDNLFTRKFSSDDLGEEILIKHFNVSKNQLHDLAFFFSGHEQIAEIKCGRNTGQEKPISNVFCSALKVLCSKKNSLLKPLDQCPLQAEDGIQTYDLSMLEKQLHLLISQCETTSRPPDNNLYIPKDAFAVDTRKGQDGNCGTSLLCLVRKCWWIVTAVILTCRAHSLCFKRQRYQNLNRVYPEPLHQPKQLQLQQKQIPNPPKGGGNWRKKLLIVFILAGTMTSVWIFWHFNERINFRREGTLSNMCDERARMLQDQFNVSLNHVHALALLVSTFHHGKSPSAMNQKIFGEYTERTSFERPLTSGVAYALRVDHSERKQFEKQHGWTIKKMEFDDQTLVQDCSPGNLDPAPEQDEYAPVIFSQETVSHIVSIDMMSGKEDRENILRARESGKGVLTSPFKLLKSNHLGVVLTFAVYNDDLPSNATPEQRTEATVGYIGASYDVPSLVEKLLHQLASKQTIVVNVYDTTNKSGPINMYGDDVVDTGLVHVSSLDFGDPLRKHEMHCRFKQKLHLPWTAINSSLGAMVITLLVGHIFQAAINRIAEVEEDYRQMMELKSRAEAADVAKSQFLATVSHEIRTPMNGVLGMLQMVMDTNLDTIQMDYAQTAHASGKDLILLINEVLDQAKIESGRLELETVPFDLRAVLDNILSLSSGISNEKHIELAVYVSNKVPDIVVGDPGRFRQIITNLVRNSIKFTLEGHILISVHLAEELQRQADVTDRVLCHVPYSVKDASNRCNDTLSGFPVVERRKSWEKFKKISNRDRTDEHESVEVVVTVEDTGIGIPMEAQKRIFTPFMQADSSTSRTYGGTGIGLSISKCLVDLMRGEISFVSEPGKGSTFSFAVPFSKYGTNCVEPKLQNQDPIVTDFRGLRALVIDRRGVRAEVTRYHLQRLDISVEIACSLRSTFSELSNFAMVLIHEDVWGEQDQSRLSCLLTDRKGRDSKEVKVNLPKIFLMATSINPSEKSNLKSVGFIDNILTMPLQLSIMVACFQEALGNRKIKTEERKKPLNLRSLLQEKRILVVDDNVVNRRVAEGALKRYGAIVNCVESGRAAVEMLHPPHDFHICFMDLQMPGMDGFEATRRIRSIEKEVNESGELLVERFGEVGQWRTPILAMTADATQASNEECIQCGMDDYVFKPFEEEQLYAAVARFLSQVESY